MKRLSILFAFCLAAQVLTAQQNVLLIIADDMGTDYCSFYNEGLDTANMPNVRALLHRGVRFSHTWSMPICSPARAGMLTGRYPFRTGVGTVITSAGNGQLDTAEISIGKLLKNAAPTVYATANIGKWHLHTSTPANRNNPAVLGYDHYSGNFIGQVNDYYNWTKIVDGAAPVTVTNYATTEQVDDAIAWLGSLDGTKPFFLWQAFNAPHFPFHVPPANLHTVPGLTGTAQDIQQNPEKYYKAMIEAMDTEIGRLFQWLDAHNMLANTNIIFIGDNGDDNRITQYPNAMHTKSTVYEQGVQVPMIIAGPAVVAPNRSSDALVSTPDLFATILELAGFPDWKAHIPASKPVDAQSLLPILKNESASVRDWIFTEIFDPAHLPDDGKAMRDLTYKLIRFDDGHEEFYHIVADQYEGTNLLLQLPLAAEAQTHYHYLCNEMSALLGSPVCLQSVGTLELRPELALSPNPVRWLLNIDGAEALELRAGEVLDAAGRQVMAVKDLTDGLVDVSDLLPGTYWLKMRNGVGKVFMGRFVKM